VEDVFAPQLRVGRVVTFDACDRSRSVDTVFSSVVTDVIERYLSEFRVFTENNYFGNLFRILGMGDDGCDVTALKYDEGTGEYDNEAVGNCAFHNSSLAKSVSCHYTPPIKVRRGRAHSSKRKRFSPVQEASLSNKETIDLSPRRRYDDENICRDLNRSYENKFPSRSSDHIPSSLHFHIE
jgi:hypothetical protein